MTSEYDILKKHNISFEKCEIDGEEIKLNNLSFLIGKNGCGKNSIYISNEHIKIYF